MHEQTETFFRNRMHLLLPHRDGKKPAILMPFVADRAFGHAPIEVTDAWNLHSIKNGMAYTVVSSLECIRCGLVFLDMRFDDAAMSNLYTGYRDEKYALLRDKYENGYLARNRIMSDGITYIDEIEDFLHKHLNSKLIILDWGGDTGKNTPFKQSAQTVHIYDVSDKPVLEGLEKVDLDTISKHNYDLIICSMVLEHIPYPDEVLLDIKSVMHKETLLYIELPCENHIKENKEICEKRHWHEHINFFTERSLRELLTRVGFDIVDFNLLSVKSGGSFSCNYQIACKVSN